MIRAPRGLRTLLLGVGAALGAACAGPPDVRFFGPEAYPARLSEWGVVSARGNVLELGRRVLPYDLATPLFTDYAHKLRTVWMPDGVRGEWNGTSVFELPVGTILSKTFFYPRAGLDVVALTEDTSRDFLGSDLDLAEVRLIETRLLVRQSDGWHALPYVWDAAQGDAFLTIAGTHERLSAVDDAGRARHLDYLVPTRNECASCHASDHTSGALRPIGIAARHLDKTYAHYATGPAPQLRTWVDHAFLDRAPATPRANALWRTDTGTVDDLEPRARAYLDINCGHCHSPTGAADTTGLWLDHATTDWRRLGLCKPPIAAGRGTGGREHSIVPGRPDASILVYRMASDDPAVRMPEIGRTTVHAAGLALVTRWVESLPGACVAGPSS